MLLADREIGRYIGAEQDSGSKTATQCSPNVEECSDENDLGDLRVADDMSRLAGFATAAEVRAIVERSTI
jgi:hypothetical protein